MPRKRMLVVDDEIECCELIRDYFIKKDYIVDIISDPTQAKRLLDSNAYEYIIFDYSMPAFSGQSLAKIIKEKNPQAKKILMSGYDLVDDEIVKNMQVDAFLRKPFVLDDLAALIKNE